MDVFRRADACPDVAREAVEAGAGALWLQLGLVSAEARGDRRGGRPRVRREPVHGDRALATRLQRPKGRRSGPPPQSGCPDSNRGPRRPERRALPGCATPRTRDRLPGMPARDEIVAFANEYLELASYPDYGPMGLQVVGADEVTQIACGVSASRELFERAAEAGAQLVLVHHGLFWEKRAPRRRAGDARPAAGALRRRPEPRRLPPGARRAPRGRQQRAPLPSSSASSRDGRFADGRLRRPAREPWARQRAGGARPGASSAGCRSSSPTGPSDRAGRGLLRRRRALPRQAAAEGYDCFVTGEAGEPTKHAAKEAGVHFVAAGHYATETLGVRALTASWPSASASTGTSSTSRTPSSPRASTLPQASSVSGSAYTVSQRSSESA